MAKPKTKTAAATPAAGVAVDPAFLKAVVDATIAGAFIYSHPAVHAAAVSAGLVEVNSAMADPTHGVATRATAAGIEAYKASVAVPATVPAVSGFGTLPAAPAVAPTAAKVQFTVDAGVPIPEAKRGGRGAGTSIYPFDAMLKDQSFFVPATEAKPTPAKTLASTISAQNQKYSEVVPGEMVPDGKGGTKPKTKQLRHFIVRSVVENNVKGARVWRDL